MISQHTSVGVLCYRPYILCSVCLLFVFGHPLIWPSCPRSRHRGNRIKTRHWRLVTHRHNERMTGVRISAQPIIRQNNRICWVPPQTRKEYMASEASPYIPKTLLPFSALRRRSNPSLSSLFHLQASAELHSDFQQKAGQVEGRILVLSAYLAAAHHL